MEAGARVDQHTDCGNAEAVLFSFAFGRQSSKPWFSNLWKLDDKHTVPVQTLTSVTAGHFV